MEAAESAEVEQRLHFAGSAGEGVRLPRDQVEGTESSDRYYWMSAMGNSATPPTKSVKFW